MTVVTIEEAKTRMDELAHLAASGEDVRIAVSGGMLLELRPVSAPEFVTPDGPRTGGQWAGEFELGPEFFEPMPEEWLKEFYEGPVFPPQGSDRSVTVEHERK